MPAIDLGQPARPEQSPERKENAQPGGTFARLFSVTDEHAMSRLIKSRALHLLIAALFALSFVASACSSTGGGVPATPGQYSVQKDSVRFDGDRYQLYWADNNGS